MLIEAATLGTTAVDAVVRLSDKGLIVLGAMTGWGADKRGVVTFIFCLRTEPVERLVGMLAGDLPQTILGNQATGERRSTITSVS